jgi:hypothetical protein
MSIGHLAEVLDINLEPAVPVQRSDHCATACSWRALSAFTVELRISTILEREFNEIALKYTNFEVEAS